MQESEKSSRYFVQRYRQGLDNIQSLLIAREQEMTVKMRLNQAKADRLGNRVDLALAVGIGLEHKNLTENSNIQSPNDK